MSKDYDRPETNLVQLTVPSVMKAQLILGTQTARKETPIVLVPKKKAASLYISIPAGCSAIVTKRGASVGVWKAGFHLFPPWYQVAYLVTTHYIPYHFSVKECPTRDNVLITIHVDFLLHITDPEKFVYSIGPENMEELLRATQAESVRSLVRQTNVADAYSLRGADSDDMLTTLNDKMNQYGINVDQVTISNVALPKSIAVSMQVETTFESKQTLQMKEQQFEMQKMNFKNICKRADQDRVNEAIKIAEEGKKERMNLQQDIEEYKARMAKELAEIKADERGTVTKLKAESELIVGKINAEKKMLVSEVSTNARMQVEKLKAENSKYVAEIKRNAQRQVAENEAAGLQALAKAEHEVSKGMVQKRKFDSECSRIALLNDLANNDRAVFAGDAGNSLMQLLSVRESAKALGVPLSSAQSNAAY